MIIDSIKWRASESVGCRFFHLFYLSAIEGDLARASVIVCSLEDVWPYGAFAIEVDVCFFYILVARVNGDVCATGRGDQFPLHVFAT